MKPVLPVISALSGILILLGCSPRVMTTTQSQPPQTGKTPITTANGDTTSYVIEFSNTEQRTAFTSSFKEFLHAYPFVQFHNDSSTQYIRIMILPQNSDHEQMDSLQTLERSAFIEKTIEGALINTVQDTAPVFEDTLIPEYGGTVRIYHQRTSIDPTFSSLTSIEPFSSDSIESGILTVTDLSQRKITFKLSGRIVNGSNKVLSALDFIDLWTRFIKMYPAEGLALFRSVQGVREFIEGKEALIRGFGALDEKTVYLKLQTPDSSALERLRSRSTLNSLFRMGKYYIEKSDNGEHILLPNVYTGPEKPYLDKIILRTGGDPNPILSFSLNKYDAVVLTAQSDLEYARNALAKNSSLLPIPGDRYFLSCATRDLKLRQKIKSIVTNNDLLHNFVKAEGNAITALCTDEPVPEGFIPAGAQIQSQPSASCRILYRKDDPISKIIAEKLLADLSHASIPSTLIAADHRDYEQALIARSYDCAVGWVPETILHNRSEQLKLAAIWFDDEKDETRRLQELSEIPLFQVNKYILARTPVQLHRGSISGLFIKKDH